MKKILCSYKGCSERRKHWSTPDECRKHQEIEVPDDFKDKAYCSIECKCYDGAMKVSTKAD